VIKLLAIAMQRLRN